MTTLAATRTQIRLYRRRLARHGVVVSLAEVVLVGAVLLAIVVPIASSQSLVSVNLGDAYLPPIWAGGSASHFLGTDQLGRDMLELLGYGIRLSLLVGITSTIIASIIGSLIGIVSGYLGGWVDMVFSRVVDAQLAFPVILIGLCLAVFLHPSVPTVVAAVVMASWPTYARVVRSQCLLLKESDFVALATVSGLRRRTIMWRHLLPNVLPSIVVIGSQNFGQAVLYEAALSYLGVGVQPPSMSLGLIISNAQQYMFTHTWLIIAPTIVLALISLSANILGDWLRDRLDPTLRAGM
jgi:peptide/nickel transport system permease protein